MIYIYIDVDQYLYIYRYILQMLMTMICKTKGFCLVLKPVYNDFSPQNVFLGRNRFSYVKANSAVFFLPASNLKLIFLCYSRLNSNSPLN